MKKNYISPEILVLNANIMSELLSQSGNGSGNGSSVVGDNVDGIIGDIGKGDDDDFEGGLGTKGSIFTWSDDYDNESYD